MVCSLRSGRMAVMARLLEAGSFSQNVAEEVGLQKLAAQYIYGEICEADEANLLDEEDMHVFGLKPMADPLHLVCCNACKKPVKASHYAAHAERCRSLSAVKETISELDGGTGRKKPPRKERKKLLSAYTKQATPVGVQERSESIDADANTISESHMDGQVGNSSFSIDAKNMASIMAGSEVSPENTGHSACVMPPRTKRSKVVAGGWLPVSDETETASGVTKIISTQNAYTSRDFPRHTISGSEIPNDCLRVNKIPRQVCDRCLPTKDVLGPLATKIYYSQRNNHFRSALTHLFQEAATKEHCDMVSPQASREDMMQSQAPSQRCSSLEQVQDLLRNKLDPSARKPDQILAPNSEACLSASGGICLPASNFSNQLCVDNALRPQVAPVGLMRRKYISKPYYFAGNSGKLLGTQQQPNGSVPVV